MLGYGLENRVAILREMTIEWQCKNTAKGDFA
jgi:hypothetical protein